MPDNEGYNNEELNSKTKLFLLLMMATYQKGQGFTPPLPYYRKNNNVGDASSAQAYSTSGINSNSLAHTQVTQSFPNLTVSIISQNSLLTDPTSRLNFDLAFLSHVYLIYSTSM